MTFELPVPTVRETNNVAHGDGARGFVQPAPLLADPESAGSIPWDQVDVLVPNEIEARALMKEGRDLGVDDLAAALSDELAVPPSWLPRANSAVSLTPPA